MLQDKYFQTTAATQLTTSASLPVVANATLPTVPGQTAVLPQPVVTGAITAPQTMIETSQPPPPIPGVPVNAGINRPIGSVFSVNIHQPPPGYAPIPAAMATTVPDAGIVPPGTRFAVCSFPFLAVF